MKRKKEKFIQYLKRRGLKLTKQRAILIDQVLKLKRHFEADDLLTELRNKKIYVSRGTIYRTIPLLIESGILRNVIFTDRHKHFENVTLKEHHEHLICKNCGKIIEFKNKKLEKIIEETCKKYGFQHKCHKTEIIGLCRECAKKMRRGRKLS